MDGLVDYVRRQVTDGDGVAAAHPLNWIHENEFSFGLTFVSITNLSAGLLVLITNYLFKKKLHEI